ncbi:MAG: 30S ribosomal protein S12 methylthiotransferase RimO [Deltaproteobacteria bacterium]|nr:30S ribosomal protein S12 methylthiotransferase RimO [Candidatus Tharpella aukensis]
MLKIAVINLGCPKNEVDAEKLVYLLLKENFQLLAEPDEAEVIIVNTCAFIQPAVEEAVETILYLAGFKESGCCRLLVVTGCLPQRYGAAIGQEIPEIDLLFGTADFHKIPTAIKSFLHNPVPDKTNYEIGPLNYSELHAVPQQISPPLAYSYLKIAEGCDNRCSYCMIPSIKGPQQSAPLEVLVAQAQQMITAGVREINLVAQDITAYGNDLVEKNQLSDLLKALIEIPSMGRLRLLYAYPHRISTELVELIAQESKICNYIDIPIQHISDPILTAMGRHDRALDIRQTLENIKNQVPDIYLRSTVIVGFPGESEEDFKKLVDFIGEGFFDYLGAFAYWPEDGSRAAKFPRQIPQDLKEERLQTILDIQQGFTEKRLRAEIGRTRKVLIEGLSQESDLLLQGRTAFQAPEIDGLTYITEGDAEPGTIVDVEIHDCHEFDLFGRIK